MVDYRISLKTAALKLHRHVSRAFLDALMPLICPLQGSLCPSTFGVE